ncbi:hypothetical protein T484DRAFT_1862662 [Baffinella frigidus]|nr:hypothetical protein T484DRAFT_1862662 [Cryptophyta sp. CCMP2293]
MENAKTAIGTPYYLSPEQRLASGSSGDRDTALRGKSLLSSYTGLYPWKS